MDKYEKSKFHKNKKFKQAFDLFKKENDLFCEERGTTYNNFLFKIFCKVIFYSIYESITFNVLEKREFLKENPGLFDLFKENLGDLEPISLRDSSYFSKNNIIDSCEKI